MQREEGEAGQCSVKKEKREKREMYISGHVVHIRQQLTTVGRAHKSTVFFSPFSTATTGARSEHTYKTMHKGSSVGLVHPFVHSHRCS